MNRGLARFRAS